VVIVYTLGLGCGMQNCRGISKMINDMKQFICQKLVKDSNVFSLPSGFRHIITNDGETWFKPMKFLTDALELELDKVPSNKVLEDDYHLWYIGKSYNDCYNDSEQFPFKVDHAKEYARRCIFYFTMYLNKKHNYSETQHPKLHR